ncbi:TPA: zinc ribbon domain-containing protein [Vibrio campbellii]
MPIRGNMDSKWECFGCGHSNEHSSLKCEKCGSLGKELANKQMANHLLGNDKVKSKFEYCCDKCGSESYEVGELRASGGFWSTLFNYNKHRFYFLSCSSCGHTEFYKRGLGTGQKILDFLGG